MLYLLKSNNCLIRMELFSFYSAYNMYYDTLFYNYIKLFILKTRITNI